MAKTYFRIQSDFIEHRLPARNVGRASVPNETMEMRQSGRARLDSGCPFPATNRFCRRKTQRHHRRSRPWCDT